MRTASGSSSTRSTANALGANHTGKRAKGASEVSMSKQMTTGNHPVLPPLREQHKVTNFKTVGQWEQRDKGELEALSDGLKVEKTGIDINSIPDMWARPLLFEMALYDSQHPLHKRIEGEWRGMLAMLALRETAGMFTLKAIPVNIPQVGTNGLGQGDARDFVSAVSKLMPKSSLSSDTTWNNIYVLLFDGRPIGMTSPLTLVATATDYFGRITNVPWFDGRYLTDPAGHLGANTRQELVDWLKNLEKSLTAHGGVDIARRDKLLRVLGAFIGSLGAKPSGNLNLSRTGLDLQEGVFRYISFPIRGDGASPLKSHVRLVPSRQDSSSTPILVLDRNIAPQWQVQEHEVMVWGAISLKTAIPFGGVGDDETRLANNVVLQGARAWRPEKFFTEKLFVIRQENALPGALKTQGSEILRSQQDLITPILPIDKTLIEHLTGDDLAERVSFEQTTDGILVRLRLPLAGTDLKGRDYEILKEYRADEHEIIFLEKVPVLEIWPNFTISGQSWKAYYTYFSTGGAGATFHAKPYTPDTQSEAVEIDARRIIKTDRFPEVMVCEGPVANVQTNRTEMQPAGLLLVSQPTPIRSQNKFFKVGIDFGASGTSVYAREQGQAPFRVDFSNRFLNVTDPPAVTRSQVDDYFLPLAKVEIPFLSIFHDFLRAPNGQRLRPLVDGHIFFREDYRKLDTRAAGVATDLKWSERPEDRLRVRAFLEQLCLLAAAEVSVRGASRVDWAYSFPTAFKGVTSAGFRQIWSQVTAAVSDATGLAQSANSPTSRTESEASALFFKSAPQLNASTHVGTVCIDIGGSTSDIAIWQEDSLRWQTSLRFAGRDIFLDYLKAKPDFLAIFGADVTTLRETANSTGFYTQADAILRQMRKEIFAALPDHASSGPVQDLVSVLSLGLSGLFFYVGSVLRYLMNTRQYKEEIPDIYIGGNGSLMFHWLDAGEYSSRSHITGLFKEAFLRGAGLSGESIFKIRISPSPKAEAAYGLVTDGGLIDQAADGLMDVSPHAGVVAGERFLEEGHDKTWDELLDAKRLTGRIDVPQKLERLEEFIETFNRYAKLRGMPAVNTGGALMREVRNRTASTISQFRGREDDSTVLVEPIFIVALKHLIEVRLES